MPEVKKKKKIKVDFSKLNEISVEVLLTQTKKVIIVSLILEPKTKFNGLDVKSKQ